MSSCPLWFRWWLIAPTHMLPYGSTSRQWINSLAPRKFECNFRYVIFKSILVIDSWGISCEIALIWMSLDFTDDQSTLVQIMAWCRQATSHYLSQCWPRFLLPYGVTGAQWVKLHIPPQISIEYSFHLKSLVWKKLFIFQWSLHIWNKFHSHCSFCTCARYCITDSNLLGYTAWGAQAPIPLMILRSNPKTSFKY